MRRAIERIALTGIACSAGADIARAQEPVTAFVYAEDARPSTLNPLFRTATVEVRLAELLFDGLYSIDRFLKPVPELAESATIDADRMGMTIHLRAATWHDGSPVTAEDVVFTIETIKDPNIAATERGAVSFIRRAETRGARDVHLTFQQAVLEPERRLTFKILPKHKFNGKTPERHLDPFRVGPLGSGPYEFVRWEDVSIDLKSTRTESGLPWVQAKFVDIKSAQLQLLQFGALHAMINVLPKQRPVVSAMAKKFQLIPYDALSWWYLGINHRGRDLSSRNVRLAISHALDRDAIRNAHLGEGQTISGPFSPRSPYYDDTIEPDKFDLTKTRELMNGAGYVERGGVWCRGDAPMKLRFVVNKDLATQQDVVLDIQARLQRAGFDVELEWQDPAAYRVRVEQEGKFELTLGIWTFDEGSNVFDLFHKDGARNYFRYSNPKMDALLEQSTRTLDPELFGELYSRVHREAHDDLPYVFLWSVRAFTAVTTRVQGVDIHPYRFFTWIEEWRWK